jgi:hypothetical protein
MRLCTAEVMAFGAVVRSTMLSRAAFIAVLLVRWYLEASRSIPTRVSGSVATRGIVLPAYRCRVMNVTLLKALVALVPACMLFSGSMVLSLRGKTVSCFLQLLGAGCLVLVVLTHGAEALHLFPWMHWGSEHSVGHYIDLWSAVLGLTLFSHRIFVSCAYNAARLTFSGEVRWNAQFLQKT